MALFVDGLQLLIDHLGVHLGGRDVAVAHQLLQRTNVCTVFQKVNCEAVAQRMRRDLLLDACSVLVML